MLNRKKMSINQRINENGNFPGINLFVIDWKERTQTTFGGVSFADGVRKIRAKSQELNANHYIMASKKMKQELRLVGVGKYLKKEN